MLKTLTNYARKFRKNIHNKCNYADLSQKGSNYAKIMLKTVSVMSLCQNYARSCRNYARIMLELC